MSKKPTVKLWCLLGDTTGDVSHYETAWRLSGGRSSRAQRQWGYYYFTRKNVSKELNFNFHLNYFIVNFQCNIYIFQYAEAVPHLKLSVEFNNIQEGAWFRLGFAALQIENWNLAATAYRRYCALEPSVYIYILIFLLI